LVAWLWPGPKGGGQGGGAAIFGLVWLAYAIGAVFGALGNAFVPRPLLLPALLVPFVMGIPRASRRTHP
jgi:hypothetical protein